MICKSYILEQNLEQLANFKAFLFYGENQGLKKEFKEKIRVKNKDFEIITLFQEEIINNENILVNEINNKSLFNDK